MEQFSEVAKVKLMALTEYAECLERSNGPYLHAELFQIARAKARIINSERRKSAIRAIDEGFFCVV